MEECELESINASIKNSTKKLDLVTKNIGGNDISSHDAYVNLQYLK